ncbi:hypothetical protein QUC31_013304 [Theobroma cacao]|uniref:Uncharacterized protein n=1 Tax=Theobroma cacao TaxID=3641 RepID=A0A061GHN6_THECC|nr:Uncharacterized protein TCM_030397 [Theobroma cacao]
MGRESINDPTIVFQSSIALLQERFRQLQRMKEMREERELLRKHAEPKQCNPTLPYEPSRLFFHFLPPRSPPPQVPFSIWSGSQHRCSGTDSQSTEAPLFESLLPTASKIPDSMHVSQNKFDDSDCDDVDTSLHL